jgi:regulator of PEP synthase PpsR (kinase-PPPase family)
VKAANYPLTEDDLEGDQLPKRLRAHKRKLFGLTIEPVRLQQIRNERKPGSRYATLEQCRKEVALAELLFRTEHLPSLSTTHTSIEEIASKVLANFGIQRHMF